MATLVTALLLPAFGLPVTSPAYADNAAGSGVRAVERYATSARPRPGTALAWGANSTGQLGDGTRSPGALSRTEPLGKVMKVAAGDGHSLALLADGTVVAWGSALVGRLGNGSTPSSSAGAPTATASSVTAPRPSAPCPSGCAPWGRRHRARGCSKA